MASKNVTRKISIFINGKEVKNNLNSVGKEIGKLKVQLRNLVPGTQDFINKSKELKKAQKAYASINNEIRETEGLLSKIKKQAGAVGFPVAGALLFTQALGSIAVKAKEFITNSVNMAIEAKGIEFAFKRLGDEGEDAFKRVKASTRGLLSDLEIKKSLVEFDNFNISLEETDTLFEFLALRATQTGESVDKLKQSLVEGLSKESKLRIDNLGISTAALNEELERTPNFVQAVANIAKTEIVRAGDVLDNAASSTQKWNATLQNTQLRFGNLINNTGAVSFFQKLGISILNTVVPLERTAAATELERVNLLTLESKIKDVNTSNEDRLKLINELKIKYPKLLENIDAETVSNKDLTVAIKEVNNQLINKIILQDKDDEIAQQNAKTAQKRIDLFSQEDDVRERLIKLADKHNITLKDNTTLQEQARDVIKQIGISGGVAIDPVAKLSHELNDLNTIQNQLNFEVKKGNILLNEKNKLFDKLNISGITTPPPTSTPPSTPETTTTPTEPTTPKGNGEGEEKLTPEDRKILNSKKKLAEIIAAFDEEQRIQEEVKKFEKSQQEEEAEVLRLENKYLKMAEDAGYETVVAAGLEDVKNEEIQKVRDKWDLIHKTKKKKHDDEIEKLDKKTKDAQIAAEIRLENAKKTAMFSGISSLKSVFNEKTAIYKVLFGLEKTLAINEIIVSAGKANANITASTAIANSKAIAASPLTAGMPWVAINTASATKNITANNLVAAAEVASIAASALKGFKTGGYTGIGESTDVAGVTHKDEYVVPKFIMQDPTYAPIINQLETKRTDTLGVENSLPASVSDSTASNSDLLIATLLSVQETLQQPLFAQALIGDAEIQRQKLRNDKLEKPRQSAKIK